MNKLSTGMLVGGIIGISSLALLTLDKNTARKVQKKGQNLINKAEDFMQDIKEMI
jgi:gas vesicle protein